MIDPGQVGISTSAATWLGLGTLSGWGMCRAFADHVHGRRRSIAGGLWTNGAYLQHENKSVGLRSRASLF
jgi:hypothetical protein